MTFYVTQQLLNHSTLAEVTEEKACLRCALHHGTKVSQGLGQHCATCSEAMDRDGDTEDGGGSAGPVGLC